MWRRTIQLLASSSSSSSAATTAAVAAMDPSASLASFPARVAALCSDVQKHHGVFDDLAIVPESETECRGLVAKRQLPEGRTVMSIPLQKLGISSRQLLQSSETLQALQPPSLDEVRHLMMSRSIQDPVLYEQVHLALLVAAEHLSPGSRCNIYLNVVPHPAIDDEAVIQRHKDVVDPLLLVEWADYQKEMLAVLHLLLQRWGPQAPPVEVAYWALRTVMSRMHMLPVAGLAPQAMGSTLSYTALSSVDQANVQTRWWRRLKSTVGSLLGNPVAAEEYHLVPTLVPLIDMTPHLPSSNVQVEMGVRDGVGSCVELRTIRPIDEGEAVGMRFNCRLPPAFALFRFGFIPQ